MNDMRRERAESEQQMSHAKSHDTTPKTAPTAATAGQKKARSKKKATPNKAAAKGQKRATAAGGKNRAQSSPRRKSSGTQTRRESKSAKILELIGRPQGATLPEIMQAISWQAHSVRGFLSTAVKKHALKLESTRNDAGERKYHVVA
jgi:hypothetical protein